jgi:uncharacterized OB-fold protein
MDLITPEKTYFSHLSEGRFMLQRSRESCKCFFYPRVAEPTTGSRDLEWIQASGLGIVHATTVVRPKPPQQPYNVALVELQEGPRVMSRVEGIAPQAVRIGMCVRARIGTQNERPILLFDVIDADIQGDAA